jgi:hypothetical protein
VQSKTGMRRRTWLRLAVFPFLSAFVAINWFADVAAERPGSSTARRTCYAPVVLSNLASGLAISFVVIPPIPSKTTGARLPIASGEALGFCCGLVNLPQLWATSHGPQSLSVFLVLTNLYVFVLLRHFAPFILLVVGAGCSILWPLGSETSFKANAFGLFVWLACLVASVVLLIWGPPVGGFI